MSGQNAFGSQQAYSVFEAMRPGPGLSIDQMVCLTYSLDLVAVTAMLISMTGTTEDELSGGPMCLADALETLGPRLRIFYQKGRLQPARHHFGILHLFDGLVHAVTPPRGASWHPKAVLTRYVADDRSVHWRFWLGSRNLTVSADREAGLVLHGARTKHGRRMPEIAAMVRELAQPLDWPEKILTELGDLRWHAPPGVTIRKLHWRAFGTKEILFKPLPKAGRTLVISPFVNAGGLKALGRRPSGATMELLTIAATADALGPQTGTVLRVTVPPQPDQPAVVAGRDEVSEDESPDPIRLSGLHAKLILQTDTDRNRLWIGSANVTGRGLDGPNVELMAEVDVVDSIAQALDAFVQAQDLAEPVAPSDDVKEREAAVRALDDALQVVFDTKFALATDTEGVRLVATGNLSDFLEAYRLKAWLFTFPGTATEWPSGAQEILVHAGVVPLKLQTVLVGFQAEARDDPTIRRSWAQSVEFPGLDMAARDRQLPRPISVHPISRHGFARVSRASHPPRRSAGPARASPARHGDPGTVRWEWAGSHWRKCSQPGPAIPPSSRRRRARSPAFSTDFALISQTDRTRKAWRRCSSSRRWNPSGPRSENVWISRHPVALERFQENTVEAAFRALTSDTGSRRFLIADEVGLGKTISSKSVAQRLKALREGPLNVVYMCPNLDIASQNLTKLSALDDVWATPPDRLPLAAAMTGEEPVNGFRLFSYTPETSLPGWKGGQRGGKAEERELIASLMARIAPKFWRRLRDMDAQNAENGHHRQFVWKPKPPKHLPAPFRAALVRVLKLPGEDLDTELTGWLKLHDNDVAEFILRSRASLTLVALTSSATRPDFLILDEFHRYADLILPTDDPVPPGIKGERLVIHRMLVKTMLHGNDALKRPALLLMSATPYRLLRLDGNAVEASRYRTFIRLVRFLYGSQAGDEADLAEARIAAHHQSLEAKGDRVNAIAAVKSAKLAVEEALRPIIARTERATTISGELFDRRAHTAVVRPDDLRIFQHFAGAVATKTPGMSGWVTTLWLSVPYPAETLFEYKVSAALGELPRVTSALPLVAAAHPQIRALVSADTAAEPVRPAPVDLDLLGLPWAVPTAPWWKLGGAWAKAEPAKQPSGKTLLFSRYIATPLAVSALLSLDVHHRHAATQKVQPFLRYEAKTPWPLVAAFMPWPNLVQAIDPMREPGKRPGDVSDAAEKELRAWLADMKFPIASRDRPDRKPWELAFDIETALDRTGDIVDALWQVRGLPTRSRRAWLKHNTAKATISRSEIRLLANWLLSAPGMAIGRNLWRHDRELLVGKDGLSAAFAFCWHDLRPYLGQRVFAAAILPRRKPRKRISYPDALRKAILAGGFEAVVDEHLAVMKLIGDDTPLEHLAQVFVGRSGRVRMRKSGVGKPARVTVHAAVPYAGAERSKTRTGKNRKLRSDNLRRAFNSPFWPHVLATTSVGQEGLDFHVWCDRIVHWDLPRDPVDFEQREGRIARYASLTVRRYLAATYGEAGRKADRGLSPFGAIFERARETKADGIGLERWWSPPGYRPISVTFDVRFSQNVARLRELQEDLTRYRLALGQPEPGLFETMVKHFDLKPGEARNLALDLSAPMRHPQFPR